MDIRRRVWRIRTKRRHSVNFVNRREVFGFGGLVVWGAIAHDYNSEIVCVDGFMTVRRYFDMIIIPQISKQMIESMSWLQTSPDFSTIEKIVSVITD